VTTLTEEKYGVGAAADRNKVDEPATGGRGHHRADLVCHVPRRGVGIVADGERNLVCEQAGEPVCPTALADHLRAGSAFGLRPAAMRRP